MSERRVLIIAGPNGAGKTTFARAFLPEEAHCPRFINADLIAAGLSPFEPEAAVVRAARVMLEEIDGCIARGESFAFETTLAGRAYLRRIAAWRGAGWHVTLFFLALPNAEAAMARVAGRVRQGGHDIPGDVIRRRFDAGRANFERLYRQAVDDWLLYDNAGEEPLLLDWKEQR
jgi:predicted ABC-type ATPase